MKRYYSISEDESKRITVLRSIALILVVYLHQYVDEISFVDQSVTITRPVFLECFQYTISRIITYIAVPMFYLISSVLLYSKEFTWKENMKKKCRTLIIPYIVWVTLYMLIYFVGQHIPFTAQYFANPDRIVAQYKLIDFIGAYCGYIGNGLFVNALWFVRDLIIFNIFALMIKKTIDRLPVFIFILTIAYWFIDIKICFNNESICFFIFGYYVVRLKKHMSSIDALSFVQAGISYLILVALQYSFHVMGNNAENAIEKITVVLGMFIVIQISKNIVNSDSKINSILTCVASYSFFIYTSHDLVQIIYKKMFVRIFCQTTSIQLMEYIIIPVLTILTCIVVGRIIKRISNKTFVLLSGGR